MPHLRDLRSDFSAIHGVRDIEELDGPEFTELAWRISTYGGVMKMRLDQQQNVTPPDVARPAVHRPAEVSSNAEVMANHADMFDRKMVS